MLYRWTTPPTRGRRWGKKKRERREKEEERRECNGRKANVNRGKVKGKREKGEGEGRGREDKGGEKNGKKTTEKCKFNQIFKSGAPVTTPLPIRAKSGI